MPRELIRGECFNVEVMWGRDENEVRIATSMKDPQQNDQPQNIKQLVNSWDDGSGTGLTGLCAGLSRNDINRLIKVLRVARNQACGKDE